MKQLFILLFLISTISANSFDLLKESEVEDTLPVYKPGVTTALSLIPGGGQIYTRHFAKGGIFLGTELLMAGQTYIRWKDFHDAYDPYYDAKNLYDSLYNHYSLLPPENVTLSDSTLLIRAMNDRDIREFDIEARRIDYVNYAAWFGGIYLWNLVDGFGVSNVFQGVENPTPKRAALLSAIPFTGAGQFYNGNFFKGAMVSVVEIGCMITAINFQRLMNDAEEYEDRLSAMPDSLYQKVPRSEREQWETRYKNASTDRTKFMWYGIFFYIYGIADAAVDAHLHGFDRHFHITGGVDPVDGKMSFALSGEFGSRSKRD